MPTTRAMNGMGNCVQLALPKDPRSQKSTDWVAWGLPRKIRKLVTDSNSAESTTPQRMSWVGASWRPWRETRNTAAMAAMEPRTLPTEMAQIPSEAKAPKSSTAVAPTLAPEETPEEERIGQRVAHHDLHDRAGRGERRPHDRGQEHSGQADLPDDLVGHGVLGMT